MDVEPLARFVLHPVLAYALFRTVNWLGMHSNTFGYVSLHPVPRASDPPATVFNAVFRAGAPVAFVLLASTGLYAVGWDWGVRGIWTVPVIYFAGRLAFNLFLGRGVILNWVREGGQAVASIAVVALLYDRILQDPDTLMPGLDTVVAEIWIAVALFLYAVLNGVEVGAKGAARRSVEYIDQAYARYRDLYGATVAEALAPDSGHPDPFTESIVYAVMIYEGFNRPPRVQALERWMQRVAPGQPRTVGPMQVRSAVPMTDVASVRAGAERIRDVIVQERGRGDRALLLYDVADAVYRDYNPDDGYVEDVSNVHQTLVERHYPSLAVDGGVGSAA